MQYSKGFQGYGLFMVVYSYLLALCRNCVGIVSEWKTINLKYENRKRLPLY